MTTHGDSYNDLFVTDTHREFYTKLGNAIRTTRTARGISVAELAMIADVTPEQIENYENAITAISIYKLIPILKHMNYPAEFENLA